MVQTTTNNELEYDSHYISASIFDIAKVALTGALVGLLVVLLSEIIARLIISPIFCRTESFVICTNGGDIAFNSATLIVNMLAVAALVKLNIFRPLLIALGSAAILWGMNNYLGSISLVEFGLWMMILYALSYALLFWILRIRNFAVALALVIGSVLVARLLLIA